MEMSLEADDLFSHMVLLGLAHMVRWDKHSPVVINWKSPELAVIDCEPSGLNIEEASLAVWNYKELIKFELPVISCDVEIISKKLPPKNKTVEDKLAQHSPLSPRIGALSDDDLCSYYKTRHAIVDSIGSDNGLLSEVIGGLGSASYWARKQKETDKLVPDGGASKWEMADRRRGDEFFRSDYLDIFNKHIAGYSLECVREHLQGHKVTEDKESYTCGFSIPSKKDVLRAWVAYHGFAAFPTRPVTRYPRRSSLSSSTVEVEGGKTWFVLPAPKEPITLERYLSVCRSDALIDTARAYVSGKDEQPCARQRLSSKHHEYLHSHGVDYIVLFEKNVHKASKSDTSYWALPGKCIAIDKI